MVFGGQCLSRIAHAMIPNTPSAKIYKIYMVLKQRTCARTCYGTPKDSPNS
jgi:hypothetical protein